MLDPSKLTLTNIATLGAIFLSAVGVYYALKTNQDFNTARIDALQIEVNSQKTYDKANEEWKREKELDAHRLGVAIDNRITKLEVWVDAMKRERSSGGYNAPRKP